MDILEKNETKIADKVFICCNDNKDVSKWPQIHI